MTASSPHSPPSPSGQSSGALQWLKTTAGVCGTMLVFDLLWLGVIAAPIYDRLLGPLRAPEVQLVAALAFYALYIAYILLYAVKGAQSISDAARRGAGMGLLAYATYELTNWAVIANWPAALVPIDIAWGIVLTGAAAAVGRWLFESSGQSRGNSP